MTTPADPTPAGAGEPCVPEPQIPCDHVCLKPADHDGPHFHGYKVGPESPSRMFAALPREPQRVEREGLVEAHRMICEGLRLATEGRLRLSMALADATLAEREARVDRGEFVPADAFFAGVRDRLSAPTEATEQCDCGAPRCRGCWSCVVAEYQAQNLDCPRCCVHPSAEATERPAQGQIDTIREHLARSRALGDKFHELEMKKASIRELVRPAQGEAEPKGAYAWLVESLGSDGKWRFHCMEWTEQLARRVQVWREAHTAPSRVVPLYRRPSAPGEALREAVDGLELAWGIIANVDRGDLTTQNDDWRDAVRRWADRFLPLVGRELQRRALAPQEPARREGE